MGYGIFIYPQVLILFERNPCENSLFSLFHRKAPGNKNLMDIWIVSDSFLCMLQYLPLAAIHLRHLLLCSLCLMRLLHPPHNRLHVLRMLPFSLFLIRSKLLFVHFKGHAAIVIDLQDSQAFHIFQYRLYFRPWHIYGITDFPNTRPWCLCQICPNCLKSPWRDGLFFRGALLVWVRHILLVYPVSLFQFLLLPVIQIILD